MSERPRPGPAGRAVHVLWALAAWSLTLALAYSGAGEWLGEAAEGISPPYRPTGLLLLTALAAVVALVLTLLWASQPAQDAEPDAEPPLDLDRRRFLGRSLGVGMSGLAGAAVAALWRNLPWLTLLRPASAGALPALSRSPREEWRGARIRGYRRLGRTGAEISDISFSAAGMRPDGGGESLVLELIERGVNFLDSAPDHAGGRGERALRCALQGSRQELLLSSAFCTPQGHLPAQASVQDYMRALEASLVRLGTDYVDIVFIHACNSVERVRSEHAHEAYERLRAQGKVRFLGVSTGAPNLERVAQAALESDRFDALMLAYHRAVWPQLSHILARAAARDVGVIATEIMQGARHEGLLERVGERESYAQAALRWALRDPHVAGLAVGFGERRCIDEYLFASGQRAEPRPLPVEL